MIKEADVHFFELRLAVLDLLFFDLPARLEVFLYLRPFLPKFKVDIVRVEYLVCLFNAVFQVFHQLAHLFQLLRRDLNI